MKQILKTLLLSALIVGSAYAQCGNGEVGANHEPATQESIVEVASNAGNFQTLLKAATAAGLAETLSNDGPFTVFAPTDEAFAKLPKGTLDALLADKDKLAQVLLYHVVPGKLKAKDVLAKSSLESAQGSKIQLSTVNGKAKVNNANIVATDIEASNGVIHVIDSVILPPSDS